MKPNHVPAYDLPFVVRDYPRERPYVVSAPDLAGRATVCEGPPLPEDVRSREEVLRNLRYLAHAGNNYPDLIAHLREIVERARDGKAVADTTEALLRKIGESE